MVDSYSEQHEDRDFGVDSFSEAIEEIDKLRKTVTELRRELSSYESLFEAALSTQQAFDDLRIGLGPYLRRGTVNSVVGIVEAVQALHGVANPGTARSEEDPARIAYDRVYAEMGVEGDPEVRRALFWRAFHDARGTPL